MNHLNNCKHYDLISLNDFKDYFINFVPFYQNLKKTNMVVSIKNVEEPKIRPFLDSAISNTNVELISWIHVKPNSRISVHSDTGNWEWSLVVPLLNFEDSYAEVYKTIEEPTFTVSEEVSYFKYNSNNLELVEQLKITEPFFMNNRVPHTIYNANLDFSFYIFVRLNKEFIISNF